MNPPLQRQTQQRTIIRKMMEKAGRPLGPHEIANAVKTTLSLVGIAQPCRLRLERSLLQAALAAAITLDQN